MAEQGESKILKAPSAVSQAEIDPQSAYLAAITSLPRLIHEQNQVLGGILEELNGIHDKIDVLSLYVERKGMSENMLSPEDFNVDGDNDQPAE